MLIFCSLRKIADTFPIYVEYKSDYSLLSDKNFILVVGITPQNNVVLQNRVNKSIINIENDFQI